MLLEALSTARDLGRLHEIGSALIRNGLGDAVHRIGLAHVLERAGKALHLKGAENFSKEPPVRMREALEELGPTFIKIGQILSGRPDLLSPAWTTELARLQDDVKPLPYEELQEQLVADLGAEPEEVFASFERKPVAAASIAQVHRAELRDGTPVALKIRRPGIHETVEADLRLLKRLAAKAEERMPELRRFRPQSLVRQFAHSLRRELDLRIEAKHAIQMRAHLTEDAGIVIPRVHAAWTRERLCVMDYVEGPSVHHWLEAGMPGGVDPARIASLGADYVLRSVFVDGLFHADPHTGNMILMTDGRVGLLDFGMVGRLTDTRRLEFLGILHAVATHDVDEAVDILLSWADGAVDEGMLARDCADFIDRYEGLSLKDIGTADLLADLAGLLRENGLFLPNDVALLLKVFVTLEGLGRVLDPNFVMSDHVEPFLKEAWMKEHSPVAIARRGARGLRSLLAGLPRDLQQLALRIRRGQIHVQVDVERLDNFGRMIDKSANRLTVGLVTAALIVGTSISLTVAGGPRVAGLPLFGLLGFLTSILAGFWLLWSILRSGRP